MCEHASTHALEQIQINWPSGTRSAEYLSGETNYLILWAFKFWTVVCVGLYYEKAGASHQDVLLWLRS